MRIFSLWLTPNMSWQIDETKINFLSVFRKCSWGCRIFTHWFINFFNLHDHESRWVAIINERVLFTPKSKNQLSALSTIFLVNFHHATPNYHLKHPLLMNNALNYFHIRKWMTNKCSTFFFNVLSQLTFDSFLIKIHFFLIKFAIFLKSFMAARFYTSHASSHSRNGTKFHKMNKRMKSFFFR